MAPALGHIRALIHQQVDGLTGRLALLAPADWERPSACAGWSLADVVAHLSSGASVQRRSLLRGLDGDTSPLFHDPEERAALTRAKRQVPAPGKAADFRQEMDRLLAIIDGLQPADLVKQAWHQSGVHAIDWFLHQRLGETTFHRGDILAGLGEPFEYPVPVAEALLPAYLARLERMTLPGAAALSAGISFGKAGVLFLDAGQARFDPAAQVDEPALALDADAATLLRIATGRLHPRDALAGGQLVASGDTGLLHRWRDLFRTL